MLYLIGLGLNDEQDITLKGLEAVKSCDFIYLESYTSLLQCPLENLEKLYGKKIIQADRDLTEKKAEETILEQAKKSNVAFLVIGDPFSATTHLDLLLRAKELGIETKVIHNASVLTAIGQTGLQLYNFGKTTSIPFFKEGHKSPYKVLEENQKAGLHTLFLLDLDPVNNKFMSVQQALDILLKQESEQKKGLLNKDTLCIGCARLGGDATIVSGKVEEMFKADFGKSPHCLIIPGKLHFMEEEAITYTDQHNSRLHNL